MYIYANPVIPVSLPSVKRWVLVLGTMLKNILKSIGLKKCCRRWPLHFSWSTLTILLFYLVDGRRPFHSPFHQAPLWCTIIWHGKVEYLFCYDKHKYCLRLDADSHGPKAESNPGSLKRIEPRILEENRTRDTWRESNPGYLKRIEPRILESIPKLWYHLRQFELSRFG